MELYNNLTHLNVKLIDNKLAITKGSFDVVLGYITMKGSKCTFEPNQLLSYNSMEAITKIMFALQTIKTNEIQKLSDNS